MRAINAADAFRALLKSPLDSTMRWISPGQLRRSPAAPSSTSFSARNLSTSTGVETPSGLIASATASEPHQGTVIEERRRDWIPRARS